MLGTAAEGATLPGGHPLSEIRQELGLGGDAFPWEMLDPGPAPELRADAVTGIGNGVNASAVGEMQESILGRVFAQTDLAALGVVPVSVASGDLVFPRITDGHTAGAAAAGAEHAASQATITGVSAVPRRAVARYAWQAESAARLTGMEPALAGDARGALSEAIDKIVIAGSGVAPQPAGLIDDGSGITIDDDPAAASAFKTIVGDVAALVDGRYARSLSDLRLLVNSETYAAFAISELSVGSGLLLLDHLRSRTGGVTASAHIPAEASNISKYLVAKQAVPGRSAVLAVWGAGPVVVRDPYSRAAEGEVSLTITALIDFQVVRPDAWRVSKYRSA